MQVFLDSTGLRVFLSMPYHAGLLLWLVMQSEVRLMIPSALLFLLRVALAVSDSLCFHVNSRILSSSSVKSLFEGFCFNFIEQIFLFFSVNFSFL